MKKIIVLLLAFALVFAMTACGSGSGGGEKEEAEKPVDISNMSEVLFESDVLKVTFVGAKLDMPETGKYCDYDFTFKIDNKSGAPVHAYISTLYFGVNGMICSDNLEYPYLLLQDPNNRKTSDPFTGAVQDTFILHISKDTKEEIGEPGLIDCLLYYSTNGIDYDVEHLSVQVGTNNLGAPDFSNVGVQIVKGVNYSYDSIDLSNPNDFEVVPVFGVSVEGGGYYIKNGDYFFSRVVCNARLAAGDERTYDVGGRAWFSSSTADGYGALHDAKGDTTYMNQGDRFLEADTEVLYILRYAD